MIIVIPDAPVKAVKSAQIRMAMMARPPGSHPRSTWANRTSLVAALLSARMNPVKAKSGIADNVGVSAIRYISMKTTVRSTSTR